ncbi:CDP-glycerol glycerophosphotransferase family protein [Bacillus pumilus]|uniref:CDP-glycerol glycerophosphotransferase family protein n=1 Tax=Bacillus TaxID=1386 RepID=UPI001B3A6199|nr:CDP-glycerol glycerophosphotransferase family protein [Bacillus pumilus]MBQ4814622.1 CDP-glycerol glycerophosphotransferase family protein [Bacillus pumilus]WIG31671.1 CDP-glycerol glycerophosphotransferase family protein [Bacillus pumilus]
MIEETVQKKSVVESLKNHEQKIEILLRIDDDRPLEGRLFYLLMRERVSKQEVYLPLKHLVENQFQIEIHEGSFSDKMEQGQTYNLYVTDFSEMMTDHSESEEETEDSSYDSEGDDEEAEMESDEGQFLGESNNLYYKCRLKLDVEMPELCFIENKSALLLAVPYRTDKGNASIKVKREMKITKTNHLSLDETNLLTISGYCGVISAEHTYRIKNIQILFKRDEVEHRFHVNYQQKSDMDGYRTDGENPEIYPFKVEVPLGVLTYSTDKRYNYRMYFEFICEVNGTEETLTTPSLVFGDRSKHLKGLVQIQKKNNVPIRYEVYRKKKRQTLGIRINDYTMKTRAKYYVKSKWKKFKKQIGKIKKVRNRLVTSTFKTTFQLASKLSVKKKTVVFESFNGKQFSCNPRGIYEYMKENHPEYTLIWSVKKGHEAPFKEKGIYYINRLSLKWIFAMARAEYWVVNSRLPLWVPKPEHTTYLQTWHGTPLKRLAMDMDEVHMPGTNTKKYKKNFTKEASNWDYLISPNAYSTEIFTRAFQFQKTMIESGYPRNDFLHNQNNEETMRALKQKMNLPLDKKLILYAPTWRDDQFYKKGQYKFDLDLDLHEMRAALGDEYIIILRMHYLVAENFDLGPYEGFAYDFSHYEDIRDLYMISDLLITDYSSVFFDYANLKRPMLFYVPDIETYRDKLRGFYFDFEQEAPGPLVKETASVIDWVRETEQPTFTLPASFTPFYEKFCYLESGESSKRVVEVFLKKEQ